jgi:hypothetical protein
VFNSILGRVLTTAAAAVCIVVLSPGAASAQSTVASCPALHEYGFTVESEGQNVAQSFTVTEDVTVEAINLYLADPFTGVGTYTVDLATLTEAGDPGATVLARGTLPLSSAPESPGEPAVAVNFEAPADLSAGQEYAFTIGMTGPGSGTAGGGSGTCPEGMTFFRSGVAEPWIAAPDTDVWFELLGAPTDTDGDGTPDVDDGCPEVPGPASNGGCPLPDGDGDGIPDGQDDCPAVSGPSSNAGCPLDETPPETTIDSGPTETDSRKVKFGFSSSEAGSAFRCKLKGKKVRKDSLKQFTSCTSKQKYKRLKPGKYKFFVFAIDAAGNVDVTPAKQRFRIVE